MENALSTTSKEQQLYTKLVDDFMKNEHLSVSAEEKQKFLMVCMVNKLNPRKKEIYAIPRKSKQ